MWVVWWSFVLGFSPSILASGDLDPSRITWRELSFEASKFFLTGTTKVRFEEVDGEDLPAEPEATGELPPPLAVQEIYRLSLDSSFAGRESASRVWFDPSSAAALQRLKDRKGNKAYRKSYRFLPGGVAVLRLSPGGAEEVGLAPEEWSKIERFFYPHPPEADCEGIVEPSILFYVVSARTWSMGDQLEICTFSGKDLNRLRIGAVAGPKLEVDFQLVSQGKEIRRREVVETLELQISTEPLAPGRDAELDFLGLTGDVSIFLEMEQRLPVRVEGRLSKLGRLKVDLAAVELGSQL